MVRGPPRGHRLERVDLPRELEVARGEPPAVVGRQRQCDLAPRILDVGVVVHRLRARTYLVDEREGRAEVPKLPRAGDGLALSGPARDVREAGRDLLLREQR